MARYYSVTGNNTTGSSTGASTMIQLGGFALVLTKVYDLTVGGPASAPNDYAAQYVLQRGTAVCTVTAYTPLALDAALVGTSLAVGGTSATGVNASAEGTWTAAGILLNVPLNMRATFRYVASPGAEFTQTYTAANPLGWRQLAASTAFVSTGTVVWFE
jgi:hypothetical protein